MKTLNIKRLYLIDLWEPYKGYNDKEETQENLNKSLEECKRRLKKYRHKIIYLRCFSKDAINKIKEKVDYVYIDANHEYIYVKQDMELYFWNLKKKGLLAGHDIPFPGVAKAFVEFIYENNLKPFISKRDDWWIVKKWINSN